MYSRLDMGSYRALVPGCLPFVSKPAPILIKVEIGLNRMSITQGI